ncbi:hypothetical protein DLD82_16915 [Methanospirillum stamsii]|uniref:PAS domain-containing protein n=2 Tax=Methanospirillum stamsii TaxID=1277351 RepID=A0A2V2MUL1_9EURY|nr:hypothetical protein DLD82_16915 [Methanospirillum stamsii]
MRKIYKIRNIAQHQSSLGFIYAVKIISSVFVENYIKKREIMSVSSIPKVISGDLESLQNIIDSIPYAVFVIGSNGSFIDCNSSALQVFNASSRDDVIGKVPSILAPEKQPNGNESGIEVNTYIQNTHRSGSSSFYFYHQTFDKRVFPAHVTLKRIIYGGDTCLLSIIIDMTGQVRIEENQALIHENPYALIKLNPDLTIADVNPAFLTITGYKKEEWIGRSAGDFKVLKGDGPTPLDAINTKSTLRGTYVADFPNGITSMEYSYIPIFDPNGIIMYVYAIFADRTQLDSKINELGFLIRDNPGAIATIDLQGNFKAVNPAFQEMSHISEEKLLSMNVSDLKILSKQGISFSDIISSKKASKPKFMNL